MRKTKLKLIKRFLSGILTVSMFFSMTPVTFAGEITVPTEEISTESMEEATSSIGETTMALTEETTTASTEETTTASTEETTTASTEETTMALTEETTTTSTEETTTASTDETITGSTEESTASTEEIISVPAEEFTTPLEETTEFAEETSEENEKETEAEESCILLLSLRDTDTTHNEPWLTLAEAIQWASAYSTSKATDGYSLPNDPIKQNGDTLSVYDGVGLILLSNVKPQEYQSLNIELILQEGSFWDTADINITKGETLQQFIFLGLGSSDYPYRGMVSINTNNKDNSIKTLKSLFNVLSVSASLPENLNFMIDTKTSSMTKPLLAEKITGNGTTGNETINCGVTLTEPTSRDERVTTATIGGVIGTLLNNAAVNVTLNNNYSGTLTIAGSENNRGLFCNTMKSGTSLTASLSQTTNSAPISVKASSGDAGGFVGLMEENTSLSISGDTVSKVTAVNGNAGGLVGSCTTNGGTLDLSRFTFKNITLFGKESAGGVFGVLNNRGNYTISGGKVTSNLISDTVNDGETISFTNYGGLIGTYCATQLSNTLNIGSENAKITASTTGGSNATGSYGGVIGRVSGSSYVEMNEVTASTADMPNTENSCFGGLVGKMADGSMLNVGNVTLTTTIDIAADGKYSRGGLVGYLEKGVLRLHGTTDLSRQKITKAYAYTGQIVGKNGDGLVYATGKGTTGSDWGLKRYDDSAADNNNKRSGSDIGNWGEVVRLDGTKLTEGETGLFTFDESVHTVTVNVPGITNSGEGEEKNQSGTLSNTSDFVAYALAFDISTVYENNSFSLRFNHTVDATISQNITLSDSIDLTGTGILGIGKDVLGQSFSGKFNGNGRTITLSIGEKYGDGINQDSGNGSGQLYSRRNDNKDSHYSLALFPFVDGASIRNVTVNGNVTMITDKGSGERWPGYVAAVVGSAKGETSFSNVAAVSSNSKEKILVALGVDYSNFYVLQGGILGQYEGSGNIEFNNCQWLSTLENTRAIDNNRIGGFAGRVLGSSRVFVKECTLEGNINVSSGVDNVWVGGLIAESRMETQKADGNFQDGNNNIISISELIDSAQITTFAKKTSGGLLGYSWRNTDVTFGTDSSMDSEGNPVLAKGGVTISGSTLSANTAQFGGLVYQATGYWNATAANSIVFTKNDKNVGNSFSGKSEQGNPSGLLVGTGLIKYNSVDSALYLEVGTFGSEGAAYFINKEFVTLTLGGETATSESYFDELIGVTIAQKTVNSKTENDYAGNNNAVVSLATSPESSGIDETGCNTYTGQLCNFKNSKTRYYYNLHKYRNPEDDDVIANNLDTAEKVVAWSVSQYAAENIRDYFCKLKGANNKTVDTIINGNSIDLTHYSYYPVTPLGSVNIENASITFGYDTIQRMEESNKKPSDAEHQHYLMHHGLLYNVDNNITVKNADFKGAIGKVEKAENSERYNSGALVFGGIFGDPSKASIDISLNSVTLSGLCVTGINGSTTYAPLLINSIEQAVKLSVFELSTGAGYFDEENNTTMYAATSLIGTVGSSSAQKLALDFSNIALDARKNEGDIYVYNNGTKQVNYQTTHSVFTKATLLDSFQYASESSGIYNFYTYSDKVTYGVELSNSSKNGGRNPGKQHQYWDEDSYVTDEQNEGSIDVDYVKNRYTNDNFIRYVGITEKNNNNDITFHELDINLKVSGLTDGCGTYGDPYIIRTADQLVSLAKFFTGSGAEGFKVKFNSKVISAQKQVATSYHTKDSQMSKDDDYTYTFKGSSWTSDDENAFSITDVNAARLYLQNAYYVILKDITLDASEYRGIGTVETPFSGVIVGQNDSAIKIIGTNTNDTLSYGLIKFSQGCVVKDLTVDYSGAAITMSNDYIPGASCNPFFGGVVGYCMGGDTIIDHVSVKYDSGNDEEKYVRLTGSKARFIAAGGYVGLVGGAKQITGASGDYEKAGGGVVFRNMEGTTHNFESALFYALEEAPVVKEDGSDVTSSDTNKYFYCNPYVGRVLDGYACYDNPAGAAPLYNTDKNYTIPDLVSGTIDLSVSKTENAFSVNVNSAQGLWLLSAIVNSGAASMDANGKYADIDNNNNVDAYHLGKVRSASYDGIGTNIPEEDRTTALADESWWGGVATDEATGRISYLVRKFTEPADDGTYYAAQLTGRSEKGDNSKSYPVSITFASGKIEMSSYKNGFRGIGSSYGECINIWSANSNTTKNYRRTLFVSNVNPKKETNSEETTSEGTSLEGTNTGETTIILDMNQHDYYEENNTNYESGWWNQGAGLFTNFSYKENCEVQNLTIQGCVRVKLYSPLSGAFTKARKNNFDICVGGFAGHVFNSQGELSFSNVHLKDLNVYGGTSTGGVIGQVDKLGGNNKILKFGNWSIKNVKVIKEVVHDGSTGGLIGWVRNANVIIEGDKEKDCVDVLTVKTMADEQKYATAAGLIGALDGGTTEIKNVNIKNLTVEGGKNRDTGGLVAGVRENASITIKNCILDTIDIKSRNSINLGGVLGFHNQSTTITGITIKGASSVSGNNCNRTGGIIGRSETKVTLSGCHLEGTKNAPINVSNTNDKVTGGFIGSSTSVNSITNGEETYVNIVSASSANAGGLVGYMDNGSTNASNIAFSKVKVVTKSNGNYTGLLTGNNNSKTFNGYNILARDCTSGYDSNASVDNIGGLSVTSGTKNGLWVGNATGTIKLVAVGVNDANSPQKDVGEGSGTVSITYADYPADTTNWKNNGSTYPYVDVNPKVDLVTKASADATESSVLSITGNGVGFMEEEGVRKPIAQVIAEKSSNPGTNKVYQNAVNISSMVPNSSQTSSNSAYISSYQEEEGTQGAGDFTMLVINAAESDPNSRIWEYIAALTNVGSVDTAWSQVMEQGVTATTYKWENNGFFMQTPSTLSVTDNRISINMDGNKPRVDSGKNQFTLLDVQYDDPTNNGDKAFHLYIPVYVQKVLETEFSIQFLAGTDYCSEDYENSGNTYATAGFNEPVTCYFTYSYKRGNKDWEDALKSGENMLGYYKKILDLEANTTSRALPTGTRLTLVDKQTGQCYSHELESGDNVNRFDLSQMMKSGGVPFTPQPIYTLLEMSAKEDADGKFVIANDEKTATVKVGDDFYRPAADDEEGTKFNITVNGSNPEEGYYLTIQIPKTIRGSSVSRDVDVSNSTLTSSKSDAVAAKIIQRNTQGGKYVLYDGVTQTTTISTKHVVGENKNDDTLMTDHEGIEITLRSILRLTPAGQANFEALGPGEVHHRFTVNMKKDLKGIMSDTVIGTSNASYTYTVKRGETVIYEQPGSFSDSNLAENLTISYGSKDLKEALLSEEVIITAVITLTYPTVENYFPLHSKNDSVSGIQVCADSRVSNVESHLSITSTKNIVNDSKRYYTEKISTSTPRLIYYTVNRGGNSNGDITQQLGINPNDKVENSIHTEAEYDYSDVDEEALERAASLKYTIELFQKEENGHYDETNPLVITDYLKNISINGSNISVQEQKPKKYEWTDDNFRMKTTQKIDFSPLTGSEFENNRYIYANYKVKLTAVLLDSESNEIDGTKASDYIIYTNARIYQQMINLSN